MDDTMIKRCCPARGMLFSTLSAALVGCAGVDHPIGLSRVAAKRNTTSAPSATREAIRPKPRLQTVEPRVGHFAEDSPTGAVVQLSFQPPDAKQVLTPEQAVALALQANPDLESARHQVSHAAAVLAQARSEWYPQLRAHERYAVTDNPNQVFGFLQNQGRLELFSGGLADAERELNNPAPIDNFLTQLALEHTVYNGGRRQARTHAAESRHEARQFALAAVKNELVYYVIESYYRLLQARELVDVRLEAVHQVKQQLADAQSRVEAGTAVRSDVLAFQVRLAEVEEDFISARNHTKLAWAILENVTGASMAGWELPDELPEARWAAGFERIETAVAEAIHGRPEVFELELDRQAADHEVRAAEAERYPTIDFFGAYEVYTGDFNQGHDNFFVGLAVGLNLFDAGRTDAAERQARATVCRLRSQSKRLLLDVELAVRRAYLQLDDAKQRAEVTRRGVDHAEEQLREVEARYRGEMATITEMIDAQVALSNARVRNIDTQADVEVARTALARAVGRLVDAFTS
jgi:outer membrane protein TolC